MHWWPWLRNTEQATAWSSHLPHGSLELGAQSGAGAAEPPSASPRAAPQPFHSVGLHLKVLLEETILLLKINK